LPKKPVILIPNTAFDYAFELPLWNALIKTKFSITGQAFLALFFFFFSSRSLFWTKNNQQRQRRTFFFVYSCTVQSIEHEIVSASRKSNIFFYLIWLA